MRHVRVKITKDVNTVYNRTAPEWEIPVLEMVFEAGAVHRTGESEEVPGRDYPEPSFEYDRLVRAYGKDVDSGIDHVASVYGQGHLGIRALGKAIEAAKEDEAEATRPVARRRARQATVVDDPLLM